ncbi:MAG TPA: YqaA family protein [Gemmatimonadota bacterium]|nr:YqaA family protein [Gemmatimonadota bacterium]
MTGGERPDAERGIHPRAWHRRLYWWVLSWAAHPQGTWALAALAFAESSFFPIPPDVLLIALCLGKPHRALWFAGVTTVASVVGGLAGYAIGAGLYETVGKPILEFYGLMDKYAEVQAMYQRYDVWAVGIAGLTPIPYKVFTVTAGAFSISLPGFVAASIAGRGARFFLVAGLLRIWGEPAREFLDRHLGLLTILFAVLLVGGFVLIRVIL